MRAGVTGRESLAEKICGLLALSGYLWNHQRILVLLLNMATELSDDNKGAQRRAHSDQVNTADR